MRIPPPKGGSVELVVFELSKSLSVINNEVTIVDKLNSKNDSEVETVDGVNIARIKALGLPGWLMARVDPDGHIGQYLMLLQGFLFAISVGSFSKSHFFDIVHTHNYLSSAAILLRNRRVGSRLVQTSYDPYAERPTVSWVQRMMVMLVGTWVIHRASRIVVLKEVQKSGFPKPSHASKVSVLTSGVDVQRFNPDLDAGGTKQKYGLDAPFIVLFVGAVVERKGVEYLVKAAKLIIDQPDYDKVIFVFAGPWTSYGDLREEDPTKTYANRLFQLVKHLNLEAKIKFLGAVPPDDLPSLYAACDVFVMPSLSEGFGLVAIEAMASGKPVITTRITGMPQRTMDGWNGFLVDPGNERQLAEKIKYLMDHPEEKEQMGRNGRKMVVEQYSWDKIAERYVDIYNRVRTHQGK